MWNFIENNKKKWSFNEGLIAHNKISQDFNITSTLFTKKSQEVKKYEDNCLKVVFNENIF